MTLSDQRLDILRRVERGDLSTENASRLLEALEMGLPLEPADLLPAAPETLLPATLAAAPSAAPAPDVEVIPPPMLHAAGEAPQLSDLESSRFNFWQRWWLLPFGIGVVLTLLGAYWMYLGYMAAGLGWGFWLSWVPFGLGVVITAVAARSRTARWLHVRVHESGSKHDNPHNINISFPLPISFGAWVLRTFGRWMPDDFQKQHLDEVLATLDKALTKDAPMHVMVNEDSGDQVEVFIG
jgi:hypothetical protein